MAFLAPLAGIFTSGGFLQAAGSILSGVAGLATGIYQNNVAKMNAQIAEDNAKKAVDRANLNAQDQDNLTRAALGDQLEVQSASGLSLNSKSQVLTRKAAKRLGAQDAMNVRQGGDAEAANYNQQAANFRADGKAALFSGGVGLLSSFIDAGTVIGRSRNSASNRFTYNPNPSPRPRSLLS